jgi:hypothetical protein
MAQRTQATTHEGLREGGDQYQSRGMSVWPSGRRSHGSRGLHDQGLHVRELSARRRGRACERWPLTERGSHASIRVQVRELREALRRDADPHGASQCRGQMPQLRKRAGHPSTRGLHSQDLAEKLKTKGGRGRGALGVAPNGVVVMSRLRSSLSCPELNLAARW